MFSCVQRVQINLTLWGQVGYLIPVETITHRFYNNGRQLFVRTLSSLWTTDFAFKFIMVFCFRKETSVSLLSWRQLSNKSPMESLLHCFCLSFQNCTNISRGFQIETISNSQITKVVMDFDPLSCNPYFLLKPFLFWFLEKNK